MSDPSHYFLCQNKNEQPACLFELAGSVEAGLNKGGKKTGSTKGVK